MTSAALDAALVDAMHRLRPWCLDFDTEVDGDGALVAKVTAMHLVGGAWVPTGALHASVAVGVETDAVTAMHRAKEALLELLEAVPRGGFMSRGGCA